MRAPPDPAQTLPPGLPSGLQPSSDADRYATDASGREGATPRGVVHPTSVEALEKVIGWANRHGVPLIPVSSGGGPRRRGDTLSPRPALIVDLSRMNRVIHVDGRDAVAVVEAGVTFDQLDAALAPQGLTSFRPLLPRASKSVLAAFLEREPITTPGQHWDSADPLAALEMVFGNGDRFRTGGAALPGTLEENIERGNRQLYSFGPGQTDFGRLVQGAQGSLAIVARGSILCRRLPAVSVPWFVSSDALAPVVAVAYAMLRKRHDGHLFIVNGTQLATMLAGDPASFGILRAALPAWTLFVELSATAHFADEAMAFRRADLEAAAAAAGARLSPSVAGQDATTVASLLDRSTERPYPERAGGAHEAVFFLSQLNRVQAHLNAVAGLADPADVAVYLQPMTQGVNAHCEFTFRARERRTALAVGRLAAERFAAAGAFFSRPYHLWADLAFAPDPQIVSLLARTKALFDPKGILQPQSQALGQSTPAFTTATAVH